MEIVLLQKFKQKIDVGVLFGQVLRSNELLSAEVDIICISHSLRESGCTKFEGFHLLAFELEKLIDQTGRLDSFLIGMLKQTNVRALSEFEGNLVKSLHILFPYNLQPFLNLHKFIYTLW